MPTFDITSNFDKQEVTNAIDQAKREIVNRFDFRNTNTNISYNESTITLVSSTLDRLNAADQVLKEKFVKRNVSIKFLSNIKEEKTPSEVKRFYNLKSGITHDESKFITNLIKNNYKKIQSSYQNESIRVTAKKKDELQDIINFLKNSNIDTPINFGNFRD
ncbi:MAG: YajQ family cyclic di-GMP-binding protein [Actinomycetota bacterium]|nr:YajQ family cyclic di-GMP-binding protein [Actinomycetota bacterium]MDA3013000.1 YajQ family cyclic di-GMP-binding protein [Actinomycetota bacterium]